MTNNRIIAKDNHLTVVVKPNAELCILSNPLQVDLRGDGWFHQDKEFFKYELYPRLEQDIDKGLEFLFQEYPLDDSCAPGIITDEIAGQGRLADIDREHIVQSVNGLADFLSQIENKRKTLILISYGIRQKGQPVSLDGKASALSFNGRGAGNLHKLRGVDIQLQKAIISGTALFENKLIGILRDIVQVCQNKDHARYGIYCSKGHHRSVAVVEIIATVIFRGLVQTNHPHIAR